MENSCYLIISVLSIIVIQIGLTIRRKIIEDSEKERLKIIENNKTKRLEILASLESSKIKALGYYENKDSSLRSE